MKFSMIHSKTFPENYLKVQLQPKFISQSLLLKIYLLESGSSNIELPLYFHYRATKNKCFMLLKSFPENYTAYSAIPLKSTQKNY